MIIFPNCKINLGLNILARRSDGYHDLQTIFLPVPLEDSLEILPAQTLSFVGTGLPIEGNPTSNLCVKAYSLLKNRFDIPPVQMHLHKVIPTGAGLGGGSSDAAFTLNALNQLFDLKLDHVALMDLAAQVGSDCPFFLLNQPCFATGRGEMLQSIKLPQLNGLFGVVVHPGVHISTAWAFQQITPRVDSEPLINYISESPRTWKEKMVNDFEQPVFRQYPELKKIKEDLYASGACYASLSGSGAALYGIFEQLPEITFPGNYFTKTFRINLPAS